MNAFIFEPNVYSPAKFHNSYRRYIAIKGVQHFYSDVPEPRINSIPQRPSPQTPSIYECYQAASLEGPYPVSDRAGIDRCR